MIDDTVLVVDADHETEEKIVSVLEAEGCLVFTVSGRDIGTEMAGKITPSLIYLKPTSGTIEGFEVCKTIHNNEKFRNVPIILLASLKGPLDPRYTSYYGVVDYLKLPVNEEELIRKTREVHGMSSELREAEEEMGAAQGVGSHAVPEAPKAAALKADTEELPGAGLDEDMDIGSAEEEMPPAGQYAGEYEGADKEVEIGHPSEDYSYRDAQEKLKETLGARGTRSRPRQLDLLVPVLIVLAAVAVVAGGFLAYRFFISSPEKKVPVAAKPSQQVQQRQTAAPPAPEPLKKEQPAAADTRVAEKTVTQTKPTETKPTETKAVETKPAPQKAPAPIPEPKPAGKPGYSVQLGAFKSEGTAEKLVNTFKGKGYEAFTLKGTTRDGATVYRVLVGRYESKKEALELGGRIRTKEKVVTTLFSGDVK